MRLLINLLLFTLCTRALGYVIARDDKDDKQPPVDPNADRIPGPNNLATYDLPTTFQAPYMSSDKSGAFGFLWTGTSIFDLPGTGVGLLIRKAVEECGKQVRQDIFAIYLVGDKGVLMIGIPNARLNNWRTGDYFQEEKGRNRITNLLIEAYRVSWKGVGKESVPSDPVRPGYHEPRTEKWHQSPLKNIETVGEFLLEGKESIGKIINSGAVGLFEKTQGFKAVIPYRVIGERVLQGFLGIHPRKTSPLFSKDYRAIQEAFMLTVDGEKLKLSLGTRNVMTSSKQHGTWKTEDQEVTNPRLGWVWPGRGMAKADLWANPAPPPPGGHNNPRRSLSSSEEEDDDHENEDSGDDSDFTASD